MLLQLMLTMAVLDIICCGVLLNSLASAKVAMHETATHLVDLALSRGTQDMSTWLASLVRRSSASVTFPRQNQSVSPEPFCDANATARRIDLASHPPLELDQCSLHFGITYHVTGSTSGTQGAGAISDDEAKNLQNLVGEQRVSAEITATVTNGAGTVLGVGTRQLTVRVFNSPPWAIVTGARDISTVLGAVGSAEGDTAGTLVANPHSARPNATPDPAVPASFKETTINVTMTCSNSASNDDQENAFNDNLSPGNDNLPWGVQLVGRAYEVPCNPRYDLSASPAVPADAFVPNDGDYQVGSFSDAAWKNGSSVFGNPWPQ